MQALNDVVKAGYVRYIGMSSCYAWQCKSSEPLHQVIQRQLLITSNLFYLLFSPKDAELRA